MRSGRTAAKPKMRLVPVVIEENERWRMRADGRMVPLAGIEPALLAELDFESSASTSSATGAFAFPVAEKPWGRRSRRNIAGGRRGSTRADVISHRLDSFGAAGYEVYRSVYPGKTDVTSQTTALPFTTRGGHSPATASALAILVDRGGDLGGRLVLPARAGDPALSALPRTALRLLFRGPVRRPGGAGGRQRRSARRGARRGWPSSRLPQPAMPSLAAITPVSNGDSGRARPNAPDRSSISARPAACSTIWTR